MRRSSQMNQGAGRVQPRWLPLWFGIAVGCGLVPVAAQDTLLLLSGESRQGEIVGLDAEGLLQLQDGTRLGLAELAGIERPVENSAGASGKQEIYLAGGSRLRVDSVEIRDEQLTAAGPLGKLQLPLEAMRAIVFRAPSTDPLVAAALANPSRELDTLIVETDNGPQSVQGLINSVSGGKVGGEFSGEARTVALERVIAIVAADLELAAASGPQAVLSCDDGSQLQGAWQTLQDGVASVALPGGGHTVQLPWSAVRQVALASDRLRWLSDLDPLDVSEQPLVTAPLPWQRKHSAAGNRLTLVAAPGQPGRDVLEFEHGIGVHAASRLTFAVPAGFNRFAASVGIDVETQGRGDCQMVLKGDGVELWSERVRGGEPARQIQIDIEGVRELSLIVEPGAMLDLGDHADWANARFLQIQ